jgi:hypothetical protein
MLFFAKTQEILPRLKAAEDAFHAYLANMPYDGTDTTAFAEAEKVNVVLREIGEAFIQDTVGVNSRDTLESIYLRKTPDLFTLGGLTYARWVEACETGRAP